MKEKKSLHPTSVRLTQQAVQLRKLLAEELGISEAAVLELAIRELAERKGVQMRWTTRKLEKTLEQYLKSEDFKQGVISSTKASWGGSSCKVEIMPDGTWRNLWSNQIGNKYETEGVIIALPSLDCSDMAEFTDGGGTEDEYLSLAFDNERDEIEAELRDALKTRS